MPTHILTGAHDWRLSARGWHVYHMPLNTHTQTQVTTACTKTHTETPTCPPGQPRPRFSGKKQERIPWREGRAAGPPEDVLTHLVSGCQSWQWVWEAGRGAAWGERAASRGCPRGLRGKQQVFWGAGTGLVWLKDLGTGGLQTHWQRDSLRTLGGQRQVTHDIKHAGWGAGGSAGTGQAAAQPGAHGSGLTYGGATERGPGEPGKPGLRWGTQQGGRQETERTARSRRKKRKRTLPQTVHSVTPSTRAFTVHVSWARQHVGRCDGSRTRNQTSTNAGFSFGCVCPLFPSLRTA